MPIEYKIDWWAYQEAVSLDFLEAKVIFYRLNLLNGTAVVEYKLKVIFPDKKNWRLYIKSVNIRECWESINEKKYRLCSIVVTPIVAVKNDERYTRTPIEFDISVQDYLESGNWRVNLYKISSINRNDEMELVQGK